MPRRATTAEAIGMLPKNDERPPFFAFAVSLYKSDLLFRGLVDLAVAGLAILLFTGKLALMWQPIQSAVNSFAKTMQQPTAQTRVGPADKFTVFHGGPGYETMVAIKAPQIVDAAIERAAPATASVLRDARKHLEAGEPLLALDALAAGDPGDPPVLYGKAVATLHLSGNGRALEAQRLLRGATQKAYAPAFTLNGLVLFQLLAIHERGNLPASERVSLDGAGRAVEVTPAQLAAEAMLWWQRGAAFHDPVAMRLLGLAEARGLNGKRNLPAAIVYWRDAAARGDAYGRFELAQLYFEGVGVEPDSERAYDLFRQAADQGITRAAVALGAALVSKGITGDVDATKEAIRLLDGVARKSPEAIERAFSHWVLGVFLTEAAPPALRNPVRGIDHFRFAARSGHPSALRSLARAYEFGVGVERDLVRAAAYLMLVNIGRPAGAPELARLAKSLTADELARAKTFRLSDDPVTPAFQKEYAVRQSSPGLFKRVHSGLVPREEAP